MDPDLNGYRILATADRGRLIVFAHLHSAHVRIFSGSLLEELSTSTPIDFPRFTVDADRLIDHSDGAIYPLRYVGGV